MCCRKVFSPDG
ncbi:hypothetical protein F383_19883 [Gossypium arboreum]|uniref:Uncharacterized protein n=1 Tax=Gossypium arboreum TaxID=29729 RepID=A0A0B0NRV8_GOSAR|nr:hypothetical protein F383_19883 [Gossypium arboreum]